MTFIFGPMGKWKMHLSHVIWGFGNKYKKSVIQKVCNITFCYIRISNSQKKVKYISHLGTNMWPTNAADGEFLDLYLKNLLSKVLVIKRIVFWKKNEKRNEIKFWTFTWTEVQNSGVTKSCYKTESRKMTSHFELLTRGRKIKDYTLSY